MKNREAPSRKRSSPVRRKTPSRGKQPRKTSAHPAQDLSPFFESPLDLLCIGDRAANFQKINPQWEAILGYPPAEMIGRDFIEFIHPEDQSAALEAFREIERRKKVQTLTNRVLAKDGSYRWLEWKYILRGQQIFAAARDITDRKQAEDAVRESRRILEAVLDAIPIRVFWKDSDSVYLGCNRAFVEASGKRSAEEIIGRDDRQLWPQQQAELFRQDDRMVMDSGCAKLMYEEVEMDTDGIPHWLRTNKIPLPDRQGRSRGILGTSEDITVQKAAEKALRESEGRYRRITQTVTDYIYHVRVENGKAVEISHGPRCPAVTGYTAAELAADPDLWIRMVDPEDRPLVEDQTRRILSGIDSPVIEHRLWRRDGIRRWVRNTPVLHRGMQDRLLGYDGLIQDITERKEAEQQIRDQHALTLALNATTQMEDGLRLCLETAMRVSGMESGGVYLVDPDSGTMDLAVHQGIAPELLASFGHLEADSPEARLMMEDQPIYSDSENRNTRQPGTPSPYRGLQTLVSIPIHHEKQMIGFLNLASSADVIIPPAIRDTLEATVAQIGNAIGRLRTEAALRESRQMLQSVLDTIPVRVFWKDLESRFLGCNRPFARDAGFSLPADLIGRDDYQMGWVEQAEMYRSDDKEVIETGREKIGYEEPQTQADGKRIWLRTSKVPLRDPDSRIRGVLGTYEDITKQKQAEEEIRLLNWELEQRVKQRTAQLEAANQELEAFSYSISHDLRAPLRAIDGFTRILEEDYGKVLDAEGQRLCSVIHNSTTRMNGLIDDLLAFSRLSRTKMECLPADMEAMVRSVYEELTPPGNRDQIELLVSPLPRAMCDPTLLRQVWINLISNALKFSAPRGTARIEITCQSTPEEDTFSIRDNGAGFDMRFSDRLFGVFQRLHGASEFEGTGVGLAIVQRIIHRHGGRIWAEGEVDKGATFHFTLPKQ
jgi:PAS domain S-box-containing protein